MKNLDSENFEKIIKRYQSNPFMYVEYPHKRYWNKNLKNEIDLKNYFIESLKKHNDKKYLLYVHIPHCHTQCLYCTCHVEITKDYSRVKRFLDYLYKELDLLDEIFKETGLKPNFTDVHLGGGSPTYPKKEDFDILIEKLSKFVDLSKLNEFSIEIDPRRVKEEKIEYYHSKGINRISLGVQEFDTEVQKLINRVQPDKLIDRILTPKIRKLFKHGINFDITCFNISAIECSTNLGCFTIICINIMITFNAPLKTTRLSTITHLLKLEFIAQGKFGQSQRELVWLRPERTATDLSI